MKILLDDGMIHIFCCFVVYNVCCGDFIVYVLSPLSNKELSYQDFVKIVFSPVPMSYILLENQVTPYLPNIFFPPPSTHIKLE